MSICGNTEVISEAKAHGTQRIYSNGGRVGGGEEEEEEEEEVKDVEVTLSKASGTHCQAVTQVTLNVFPRQSYGAVHQKATTFEQQQNCLVNKKLVSGHGFGTHTMRPNETLGSSTLLQ